MLDLQAIEAQLAKGDPALKDVYLKLKARLTKPNKPQVSIAENAFSPEADFVRTQELVDKVAPLAEAPGLVCSNCSKVCASLAGLKAHERKCKA